MAVVAFGFVIEKFNLFVLTLADANSLDAASRAHFDKLPGPFGFGAGHAFIVVGILVILIATIRFVRTGRLLDDQAMHSPGILADLAFGVLLALLLIGLSFYLIV